MAHILSRMVDKGLVVTLVLDSCHSGGATRGRGDATARGTDAVDAAPRPQDSAVASIEELENTWQVLHFQDPAQAATSSKDITRGLSSVGSGWLPDPKGYVLLAACRPSESAYEYAFEKEEKNGALTYWLLKSLKQMDKGLTYKIIHDRLVANVHTQFPLQTPMLEGDADREIFGSDRVQSVYVVNVMGIDSSNNSRILINAGQVHGIRKGTKFAVYPLGFTDFSELKKRLAIVEVQERGSTDSWAQVITDFKIGTIEQGSQAVLIDPVDVNLRRLVRLVYQKDIKISPSVNKNQKDALELLNKAIQLEKGFLELAGEKQDKSHFQVAVNQKKL
jgi:Caspase domain